MREYGKKYHARLKNDPEYLRKRRESRKRSYYKNIERELKYNSEYGFLNRDRLNIPKLARSKERWKTDPDFRLKHLLRGRVRYAFKSGKIKRSTSALELLGCSIEFLRGYIQALFQEGMTWENYGKWHLDHIIPCAAFDFSDPEAQRECFHYTNLQPLWALDNLRKGDIISDGSRGRHKFVGIEKQRLTRQTIQTKQLF